MGESGLECVVEYEYTAELGDELTLKVGDVITNVERLEGGWWKGTLRGNVGMFPDNFVKVLPGSSVGGLKGEGGETINYGKKRCRVLFSYSPAHDDELSLEVDETIDYICEVEDGWWKGRLNGRVGVFPSNFVEMCNSDCDSTAPNNHAATVQEKNKKNSLQGSPMTNGSSVLNNSSIPSSATPNRLNESINKDTSANLSTSSPASQLNGSMTTSERLLRNTAPAPDTAPRLPPKPETSTPIQPISSHGSNQSLFASVPISSNLFDPEDEPLGPMFGSLASRIQENSYSSYNQRRSERLEPNYQFESYHPQRSQCRESYQFENSRAAHKSKRRSSLQVFPKDSSEKHSKGLFSRIRHSFGSRGSLGFLSRSRLNVGNLDETQSAHVGSPQVKRRRSFSAMMKKFTSFSSKESKESSKYQIKIEKSTHSNIDELSTVDADSTCQGFDQSPRSDIRQFPSYPMNSIDRISQEASRSWVFQDMGLKASPQSFDRQSLREDRLSVSAPGKSSSASLKVDLDNKINDFEPVGRHLSGDSGVAWDSNLHSHSQSTRDMDSFFGSIGDLTDEMFNDIFQPVAQDPEFKTIQEEESGETRAQSASGGRVLTSPVGRVLTSPVGRVPTPPNTSLRSKPIPKPRGRTAIRTNPYVNWTPPASVKKLVKIQVTEI